MRGLKVLALLGLVAGALFYSAAVKAVEAYCGDKNLYDSNQACSGNSGYDKPRSQERHLGYYCPDELTCDDDLYDDECD